MSNKRVFQVLAKKEALPGVLETDLVGASYGGFQIKDPQLTYDIESYDREVLRGTLSPLTSLVGKVEANFSFAVELSGSTHATNAPVWSVLMEACGMRKAALYNAIWTGGFTGSASGTDKHMFTGELLTTTSGGSGAVVRVIHDVFESTTPTADTRRLYYEIVSGTPVNGDVLRPSSSDDSTGPLLTIGSTSTPSTQKGWAWVPTSDLILTIDIASIAAGTPANGDIYQGATSGAILQALSASLATAAQPFRVLDGTPTSGGETLTNLTQSTVNLVASTPAYAQSSFPTLSMALIEDGRVKRIKGCRGTVSMTAERGKPIFMNFQFKGAFASVGNAGPVPGVVFTSKVPKGFQGIGFTIGSYASGEPGYLKSDTGHTPRVNAFTLDLGGGANLQEDATQATGTTGVAYPTEARKSQGSMAIDVRPEASFPVIKKLTSSESFYTKIRIGGGTNNTFLISAPGCTGTGAGATDQNNFARDDFSFTCSGLKPDGSDGADREIVLTYHYASNGTF